MTQSPPVTLILATRNRGKILEIGAILNDVPLTIRSVLDFPGIPEVDEDGADLEANALKKAREVYSATGMPSLSDDSGLEVAALNGDPGVRSARYAGDHATYDENNRKLLEELSRRGAADRRARFRCVTAYVDGQTEHLERGDCPGTIGDSCRGSGGFGYDPLFIPAGYTETFAELPLSVKNTMSHRSIAFGLMKRFLILKFS